MKFTEKQLEIMIRTLKIELDILKCNNVKETKKYRVWKIIDILEKELTTMKEAKNE